MVEKLANCLLNYLGKIKFGELLYGVHPHAIKFWSSVTCMKMFYLRIATISGSLLWVWNDSLHILYRFNDWRPPWVPIYNLIILWLVDGDLLCEQEMGDHKPWLSRGDQRYSSCKLFGMCLRIIFQSICSIFTWDSVAISVII